MASSCVVKGQRPAPACREGNQPLDIGFLYPTFPISTLQTVP